MHFKNIKFFCYINSYDLELINNLSKNTSIIYRNYTDPIDENLIKKIKNHCKKKGVKFYLSNNIKLAIKHNLNGAYIPAFNKDILHNAYSMKKDFELIGSAHTLKEIREKEKQNVNSIFLSPLFSSKKNSQFLEIYKFLNLKKKNLKKIVCLGGITFNNIKRTTLLNVDAIAAISLFKDKKFKYLQ